MSTENATPEFISVPKDTFRCMVADFEHLLDDFESIAEAEAMEVAKRRFHEIKAGKVKPLTEKEFHDLIKKEGLV